MVKSVTLAAAVLLTHFLGRGVLAQTPTPLLDRVDLEVTSIEDSGQYLVYRFRVVNSASSRSGVAGIDVMLSAPRGTGVTMLSSTGPFLDGAKNGVGPLSDHVPFGIIDPDGWSAALYRNGTLEWAPYEGYNAQGAIAVPFTKDSAPPGGSKEGFGLRSPFLPGVRELIAEPTLASCCSRPKPGSAEYPTPLAFRVSGFTVAPTVPPNELSLAVVQSDLEATCGALHWITDQALCDRLRSTLAATALAHGGRENAKEGLRAWLAEVESQHGAGKPVNANAYWLLRVNGEYLLMRM